MLEGPLLTSPLNPGITGNDPIGLAAVNERLYNDVFPGINNVVRYIRVYGSICWMAHQVEEHLEAHGSRLDMAQGIELAQRGYEKVQLVLIWLNQGRDLRNIPGIERRFPTGSEKVELQFDRVGGSDGGLLGPDAYGPSIVAGLKFLTGKTTELLLCTAEGRQLAQAFEDRARTFKKYRWLRDVTQLTTTQKDILQLEQLFDVTTASPAEQQAFLARFFPVDAEPEFPEDKKRWRSIHLTLRALDAAGSTGARGGTPVRERS